ncbi:hypothetical protein MY3296_006171 [Beauveria thailandica]
MYQKSSSSKLRYSCGQNGLTENPHILVANLGFQTPPDGSESSPRSEA